MSSLILTLIGPDRPGLVDSVATLVRNHSGNWLESRMSHLAGHFAGIVRVEVDDEHIDALIQQLGELEQEGLSVITRRDETAATDDELTVVQMELVGNDRPGIVSEVSHVFAEMQINVEEFQTECRGAPNSGGTLFRAHAELRLPAGVTMEDLQEALENLAMDLMVDINLAPRDD